MVYEEILLYHFEDFRKEYLQKVAASENPFKEVINNENALKVILQKSYFNQSIKSLEKEIQMKMMKMTRFLFYYYWYFL